MTNPRIAWLSNDYAELEGVVHPGGCTYYRQMLPANTTPGALLGLPAWTGQHGFGVVKGDRAAFGFDIVILKQIMSRPSPFQVQVARDLGQYVIVDVDDFYPGLHKSNRAWEYLDPARNRMQSTDLHEKVVMAADMVTVSTPFLHDYYSQRRDNVHLIRNGLNPRQFAVRTPSEGKPTIGWVGATGWRSNDIEPLRDWLPDFLHKHDLMFVHAGHMPDAPSFASLTGVPDERMILLPMVPLTMYAQLFTMDIGLVPLSPTDFNEAKSCIKGLEYAAAGVPFVASPTGEYRRLAGKGVGLLADDAEGWVSACLMLLNDETRSAQAEQNRRIVLGEETIVQTAPDWVRVLGGVAGHRSGLPATTTQWGR